MKLAKQKEFDLIQNEYVINQGQIKSQLGVYLRQRNLAVVFAMVCLVVSAAMVFYAIGLANTAKRVDKIVYKEDGSGGLTYIGVVNDSLKVDSNKYVANQLIEYVTALYSVPNDQNQRIYNVSKVEFMSDIQYFNAYPQPLMRGAYLNNANHIIGVNVSTVSEISKGVWQLSWSKLIDGQVAGDYQTNITFRQNSANATDTLLQRYNPLEIAITNITTVQRVSLN